MRAGDLYYTGIYAHATGAAGEDDCRASDAAARSGGEGRPAAQRDGVQPGGAAAGREVQKESVLHLFLRSRAAGRDAAWRALARSGRAMAGGWRMGVSPDGGFGAAEPALALPRGGGGGAGGAAAGWRGAGTG